MTNDQLEAELRDALTLRAAEVPAVAVDRLCRVDYRPSVRRRWTWTIGAIGAASGTAAAVSVSVLGGSQVAFAGWSATPTAATAAQSSSTQDNCQGYLSTMPGGQGSWSQVATDVRGPYTVAVYENGSSFATCFAGPSFAVASFSSANGEFAFSASNPGTAGSPTASSMSTGVASPGGGIEQLAVSHLSLAGNGPYTVTEGRLDRTVSAVTLILSNGQDVTATTVVNGWFVAWWPGGQDVTAVQITSASGTTTEPVSVPSRTPPALPAPGTGTMVPVSVGPNGPPGGGTVPVSSGTGG